MKITITIDLPTGPEDVERDICAVLRALNGEPHPGDPTFLTDTLVILSSVKDAIQAPAPPGPRQAPSSQPIDLEGFSKVISRSPEEVILWLLQRSRRPVSKTTLLGIAGSLFWPGHVNPFYVSQTLRLREAFDRLVINGALQWQPRCPVILISNVSPNHGGQNETHRNPPADVRTGD